MDFRAENLDGAYETLNSLNTLATTQGSNLVSNLSNLIGRLKTHWIGSDATVHINGLIDVYKGVATIVSNVQTVAHNASMPIVNAQTIRNSNGGSGEVGTVIPASSGEISAIDYAADTTEYYVDPNGAPQDLTTLTAEKGAFDRFCSQFTSLKEELLNNWSSGSNRDKAVSDFEQFESDVATFTKTFNDAETNLSTAVSNLKQI